MLCLLFLNILADGEKAEDYLLVLASRPQDESGYIYIYIYIYIYMCVCFCRDCL